MTQPQALAGVRQSDSGQADFNLQGVETYRHVADFVARVNPHWGDVHAHVCAIKIATTECRHGTRKIR